jgi:hypothetical protein
LEKLVMTNKKYRHTDHAKKWSLLVSSLMGKINGIYRPSHSIKLSVSEIPSRELLTTYHADLKDQMGQLGKR